MNWIEPAAGHVLKGASGDPTDLDWRGECKCGRHQRSVIPSSRYHIIKLWDFLMCTRVITEVRIVRRGCGRITRPMFSGAQATPTCLEVQFTPRASVANTHR